MSTTTIMMFMTTMREISVVPLRLDLVYIYKIMFGLVATDISDYFTLQSANDYNAITRRGNRTSYL